MATWSSSHSLGLVLQNPRREKIQEESPSEVPVLGWIRMGPITSATWWVSLNGSFPGTGATERLVGQCLMPESPEPSQSPNGLTPDATVPQVPVREVPAEQQGSTVHASSRIVDLISGAARVGIGAATLVAGELTSRSVQIAKTVVPTSIAEGPLDAVERHLGRRQDEARKSEKENRDNVAEAAESVLNRVVVGVVDMLDMEQLIDHVPINKVVARVDLPGVIDEIDLAGVIRESTTGLGAETLDASRAGLMALDLWSARVVDRILRRKNSRDLAVPWISIARQGGGRPEVIS
jgi:hypothetical protein